LALARTLRREPQRCPRDMIIDQGSMNASGHVNGLGMRYPRDASENSGTEVGNLRNWVLALRLTGMGMSPFVAIQLAPEHVAEIVLAAAAVLFGLPRALAFARGLLSQPPSDSDESDATDAADFGRGPPTEYPWGPTHSDQLKQTLVLAAVQVWALATIALMVRLGGTEGAFWDGNALSILFATLAIALLAPMVGFGVQAVRAGKLPPRPGDKPQHHHITGFGAVFLVATVAGIVLLAAVATTDRNINQQIHAQWGAFIVYFLVAFFLVVATVPSFGVPTWLVRAATATSGFLRPFGRLLSVVDSVLVYAVAPSVGVTLRQRWLGRYAYLAAYFVPLGLLGYCLPAPWGLAPTLWALVAAISVSRRWNWVEDDRETAMLTAQFRSENLRVGFDQDLRDEALLAFSTMFLFVPLALRQAQLWGDDVGVAVFSIQGANINNLYYWTQYFGSELAKAVPFVDWAEIYDVEGDGPIEMDSTLSRHVVFATRVLVDLVFLATLLQVLSTFSRNAKQIEMFSEGAIDRFDPFIERTQFRNLVSWNGSRWIAVEDRLRRFGRRRKYSLTRLLELRDDKQLARQRGEAGAAEDRRLQDWATWAAADLLYDRDYQDGEIVDELYQRLRQDSGVDDGKPPNKDAVASILDELFKPGRRLDYDDLNDVRRHLNAYRSAAELRRRLIELMGREDEGIDEADQTLRENGLAAALSDERTYDSRSPNRRLAFEALKPRYLQGSPRVIRAILRAAEADQAPALRSDIKEFVDKNPPKAIEVPDESWPLA
jgi:hypothetical protein